MKLHIPIVAALALGPCLAQEAHLRNITPEDFRRNERIWRTKMSPDGRWLTYALTRSELSGISPDRDALRAEQRTETWIAPVASGSPRKVAGGGRDGMGFDSAVWSPDSRQIALGGESPSGYTSLWLWDLASGALRQLVKSGLTSRITPLWLSDREILYFTLPEGQREENIAGFLSYVDFARAAWAKGFAGREASFSVLDSGIPHPAPQGKAIVVNTQTGQQRVVLNRSCQVPALEPHGKYFACLSPTGQTQIDTGAPLREGSFELYDLQVATLDGKPLSGVDKIHDVVPYSLRWSPDGAALAVFGRARVGVDYPLQAFLYKPATQSFESLNTRGIAIEANYYRARPKLLWTSRSELLIYARPESASGAGRLDWWALTPSAAPRNLTAGLKSAPISLLSERGGSSFLGVANGKLWRVLAQGGAPQELSAGMNTPLTSIFWPNLSVLVAENDFTATSAVVLSAQHTTVADVHGGGAQQAVPNQRGVETDLYAYDLASAQFSRINAPSAKAVFSTYSPQYKASVSIEGTRTGTRLYMSDPSSPPRLVLEINTHLKEVAEPTWKRIDYRGSDGQDLIGWIELPPGYQPSKRYPLVVDVYAGTVYGTAPPILQDLDAEAGEAEGPILTGHGYAVLFPSMPRLPYGTANDTYMDLTKGVLPAVDKAIELGVADPKRLGLIGTSFGGYSVYGLITQTKRFQAAVAMAGITDWISLYGQFTGAQRYSPEPQLDAIIRQAMAETGQDALGAPPWKDPGRYLRNSPIFYADRVETPILMIQGDMDYVQTQQGEEFFSAMNRQGKRARFVRLWTSGHAPGGANALEMWRQIFAWFDQFLGPQAASAAAANN